MKNKVLNSLTDKMSCELRHYQKGAIKKMFTNSRGKIIHATGTGKTFTFGFYLGTELKTTKPTVHIVLAHRIDLINQHIEEIYAINTVNHINCGYSVLHSGHFNDNSLVGIWNEAGKPWNYESVDSSCSVKFHKDKADESIKNGKHHIIFGTYHSADNLCQLGLSIGNVICDEAHEMACEGRNDLVTCFRPKKQFFFTATEKHADGSFGMNSKDFGKVLHKYDSQDAIKDGVLTKPRIVEITSDDDVEISEVDKKGGKIIYDTYFKLKEQNIVPKILVTARGSKHMDLIKKSKEFKELYEKHDIVCFDMSSEHGRNMNGTKFSGNKQQFIKKIKDTAEENKPLIVLQIRMADTGINIKPLNAMLAFKGLGVIARQQTYGRISRIIDGKEWAFVCVPSISLIDSDNADKIKSFIKWLRNLNPNYDPIERFKDDSEIGMGDGDEPEIINNNKTKKQNKSKLVSIIFEIEKEEKSKLMFKELEELKNKTKQVIHDLTFLD